MRSQGHHGFTLVELICVLVALSVLVGVALPRYYDNMARAETSATTSMITAVRLGLVSAQISYATTDGIGLPPDSNSDGFPDECEPAFDDCNKPVAPWRKRPDAV